MQHFHGDKKINYTIEINHNQTTIFNGEYG